MIKNVLPSLRQRAGPQRICSRQKSIRSGTARDSFSQTPHMRGKDDSNRVSAFLLGSPPRMRGKARGCDTQPGDIRITPAYAGKSARAFANSIRSRDHPRVCGEKAIASSKVLSIKGSPPRMRGKERRAKKSALLFGITPAYAGKSLTEFCGSTGRKDHPRVCGEKNGKKTSRAGAQDHPRVCGEKLVNHRFFVNHRGSPPHMRGKVCHVASGGDFPRITPAHAGKSRYACTRAPQVRGKGKVHCFVRGNDRITPAHAGKRPPCQDGFYLMEDHPRACGEKYELLGNTSGLGGSPPRMRGKEYNRWITRAATRITPAHAGKSFGLVEKFLCHGDHPRACGEKLSEKVNPFYKSGSPPRMRGKDILQTCDLID